MKDKKWLKDEVARIYDTRDYWSVEDLRDEILDSINELDESEVLSQEWIENKKWQAYDPDARTLYWAVTETDLQNLLVPKRELPVIPKFVADWIEELKQDERPLYSAMSSLMNKTNHTWSVWKSANKNFSEIMAQAWLDGYEVEKEPLFYAKIKGWQHLADYFGCKYWGKDKELNYLNVVKHSDPGFIIKFTKSEWARFGVTGDIADFEEVAE